MLSHKAMHPLARRAASQPKMKVEFVERSDAILVKTAFDAEAENSAEMQRAGWQAIPDNFGRHVEAKPV